MEQLLSIILPTKGRGEQAARCVQRIFDTTQNWNVEVIVVAHPEKATEEAFDKLDPSQPYIVQYVDCTPIQAHNIGGALAMGTHLMAMDDDGWCHDGWLDAVMETFKTIPDGYGYVKVPGDSSDYWAERGVGSRRFYSELLGGTLDIPHYISQYDDREKSDRAIAAGIFYECAGYIEHRTWVYGKAPMDDTYKNGSKKYADIDGMTYHMRKAAGFPNDYERILE